MRSPDMFLTTSRGRLAYRMDGAGEGLPLLLTPRFRGSMDDWDPEFIGKLGARRAVIRFDSAGIGLSEGETPDNAAEMADIALAFVDALGLADFDLLGWSMGGFVAQNLALDNPARVRRLIVAASSPGAITGRSPANLRVAEVTAKDVNDREDLAHLFFPDTAASRAAGLASLARIEAASATPAMRKEAVTAQAKAIAAWTAGAGAARPRLGWLTAPTLVAGGAADILMPAYGAFVLSQEAPNAKLVLYPNAGHGFLFQYIDAFTREVNDFLG